MKNSKFQPEYSQENFKPNEATRSSYYEYSTRLRSEKNIDRSKLSEINIANEVNKSGSYDKELKSFVSESSSVMKENRPCVVEYNDNLNPLISTDTLDKNVKKSAEFTFSQFKAALTNKDIKFNETSDQPYMSQRMKLSSRRKLDDKNSFRKEKGRNSMQRQSYSKHHRNLTSINTMPLDTGNHSQITERGRPKSQRVQFRETRSKSQLKEEYEMMRSEMLDKESKRIR